MVIIQESRCSGARARSIIKKFGFRNSIVSDVVGYSGGIWILWNNSNISVTPCRIEKQIVHISVQEDNFRSWYLSAIYANPHEAERNDLWDIIANIDQSMDGDWLLIGDFNEIAGANEKKGGAPIDLSKCIRFKNRISSCNLIDMGQSGNLFTWQGSTQYNYELVFKRLDRGLCNVNWRLRFPDATIKVLPRVHSDHHPFLLNTCPFSHSNIARPFRFQAMWLEHVDYNNFMLKNWDRNSLLTDSVNSFIPKIKDCNVFYRKKSLMARIKGIQSSNQYYTNRFLQDLEITLKRELDMTLKHEEMLWFQKSRKEWIIGGDRNTRYYHSRTVTRRRKNKLHALMDSTGNWCYEPDRIKQMIQDFFINLYNEIMPNRFPIQCSISYPKSDLNFSNLGNIASRDEIKKAIFSMGSFKALGEDGLPSIFYKHNWEIVEKNVVDFVHHAWNQPEAIRAINSTLLVLIPKLDPPENASQFRPIALCNVIYKCITKILANRMKPFLSSWISPYQAGFVPGRNIQDNIVIAQELTHTMKNMRGRVGYMSIKIDLEKAYDSISWIFIKNCLLEIDLPTAFIDLIYNCISSSSFSLLWNGEKGDVFYPTRGIRQGDPLSPFLFATCIDKLSHMIEEAVCAGQWKPI
ncbi:hypothetical protein RIF29_39218 [Crotalaria pallida]|uniref:Reverse transcriptase domain-containing protein n=1 Tax=Crotalaria pallida TaxID=3830 RepID=A0AAN9HQH0_CROPI